MPYALQWSKETNDDIMMNKYFLANAFFCMFLKVPAHILNKDFRQYLITVTDTLFTLSTINTVNLRNKLLVIITLLKNSFEQNILYCMSVWTVLTLNIFKLWIKDYSEKTTASSLNTKKIYLLVFIFTKIGNTRY